MLLLDHVDVAETPSAVTVTVLEASNTGCATAGGSMVSTVVRLSAPLGGRTLYDGGGGDRVRLECQHPRQAQACIPARAPAP